MIRYVLGLFIVAALAAFAPAVAAAAAAKDIDWKKVFQIAYSRKGELKAEGWCGGVLESDMDARARVSREYARIAAVLDHGVHSVLESMPEHVGKAPAMVEEAVDAYEQSFDCIPSYDNRRLLEAADELLAFAQVKFQARQRRDEQEYVVLFQGLRDRLVAKMPQRPVMRDLSACDKKRQPEGPPALDAKGCSLGADGTGWPLVVVALPWVRRRRR
ncbi:hypothetical protein [Nannocystis radixulma]|uniref:Uncharacterized protein n=1 Tax=Nannocystis radixulma TaxID=2995305 RepID=A0ABT5BH16_9BACT|nr:hypothetical protein [Nannocystis radixulma]MDC0673440.1 hypothetical protein [Nannocystis radixulma]